MASHRLTLAGYWEIPSEWRSASEDGPRDSERTSRVHRDHPSDPEGSESDEES